VAIWTGPRTIALACLVLAGACTSLLLACGERVTAATTVANWSPPGTKPLSDAAAADLVSPAREMRPVNARANRYVPSSEQLAAFRRARTSHGQTMVEFNPLFRYVTGRPKGLHHPTTDELIQWISHKWGIPTNVIRAQMVVESHWRQGFKGDPERVPSGWYGRYPRQSRIRGTGDVYESLGIAQVKWRPDGSVGAGTEPLRWRSTAFNLDYYGATLRFFYDGDCDWCGPGYGPGQASNSVAAWYSPDPWNNADARGYLRRVQQAVSARSWKHL
jgi:hypothetical protein